VRQYILDMVYTSNARGQAEKAAFIDVSDRPTITRTTSRFYTWRDQVKRVASPDGNYIDNEYDDYKRLAKTKIDGNDEYNAFDYCLCGPVKTAAYHYIDSLGGDPQDLDWVFATDKAGQVTKLYHPYMIAERLAVVEFSCVRKERFAPIGLGGGRWYNFQCKGDGI
jgi:hypothetical protein